MTRFLLDTQIVLWAAADPGRLSVAVTELLTGAVSTAIVSSVSVAEMVIKQALGKLSLPVPALELCRRLDFEVIALTGDDCQRMAGLPLLHRDPFDRLLIAQCLERDMTMVTSDRQIWQYPTLALLRND